ncbi:MAG: radical SAM family heme chaperone HemW [Rhodocyclaceae bacterium]|nr:radical SAM family heme chaperone HemW [Rhodocyclaceae bacterium]
MAGRVIPIRSGDAATVGHSAPGIIDRPDDGTIRFASLPPLALYVHLPWCVRKCPYCDFNSHEARGEPDFEAYVDALIGDVEAALPLVWGRPVVSIFFGGGTPSLTPVPAFARLMDALRARLPLQPGLEVTLEANPGTVDEARFAGYAAAGVNRISLGVQSFHDAMLSRLGRIHGGDDARRAVDAALRHVPRINIDLMHALPGQTAAQAVTDVRAALGLGAGHISAYQLTLEPNTAFAAVPPEGLPDADHAADIAEAVEATLAEAGLEHYETSAHARRGERCQHNLNYWTFGDYLGIGAGAHGKLSFADRILRQSRFKHPRAYLEQARVRAGGGSTGAGPQPAATLGAVRDIAGLVAGATDPTVEETATVAAADLPFEFAMNALRLTGGFDAALYAAHTGRPVAELLARLAGPIKRGLVTEAGGRVTPTALGRRHLNEALTLLL